MVYCPLNGYNSTDIALLAKYIQHHHNTIHTLHTIHILTIEEKHLPQPTNRSIKSYDTLYNGDLLRQTCGIGWQYSLPLSRSYQHSHDFLQSALTARELLNAQRTPICGCWAPYWLCYCCYCSCLALQPCNKRHRQTSPGRCYYSSPAGCACHPDWDWGARVESVRYAHQEC